MAAEAQAMAAGGTTTAPGLPLVAISGTAPSGAAGAGRRLIAAPAPCGFPAVSRGELSGCPLSSGPYTRITVTTQPGPARFVVPDCRRPGQAMASVPLKVPPETAERLQALADRLGTSRTALGRALLLQALAQLQQAEGVG